MQLPRSHLAKVERQKITHYLVNPFNRDGASKARFFLEFGFSTDNWQLLAWALLAHGQTHLVRRMTHTSFGQRYEIDGELQVPDGREPRVRTIWQTDDGQLAPRLITAYPLLPL